MYIPANIKPYERPRNYMGEDYFEYYSVISANRDSDCLARANFDATLSQLGGESLGVIVTRAHHWAVGWIDTLYVHRGASKKLKIADRIIGDMQDYPVLDDELFSRYEMEEKEAYWNELNLRERMRECVKAGMSMFAARNEQLPYEVEMNLEV